MEIKVVNESGQVIEPASKTEVSSGSGEEVVIPIDLKAIAISQILDMDLEESRQNKDKIKDLVEWAKTQIEKPTLANIKWAIRELESRVGVPPLGEKRINKIHRFAALELQEQR